jgi:hypothetical protein
VWGGFKGAVVVGSRRGKKYSNIVSKFREREKGRKEKREKRKEKK